MPAKKRVYRKKQSIIQNVKDDLKAIYEGLKPKSREAEAKHGGRTVDEIVEGRVYKKRK